MHNFFHGWRRKVGVVTLAMACVFMVLWFRSLVFLDELDFLKQRSYSRLVSFNGTIGWRDFTQLGEEEMPYAPRQSFEYFRLPVGKVPYWFESRVSPIDFPPTGWDERGNGSIDFAGFTFSTSISNQAKTQMRIYCIPYYSIFVPLTLLSAYLILWTPRKRQSSN